MERQEIAWPRVAAWAVVLSLSLTHFIALSASRGRHGFADLPIFLAAAAHFRETGDLYPGAGNDGAFRPAAPVYKFPPLFATVLLPSTRDGIDRGDFARHWWAQMLLYATAVTLLLALAPRRPETPWLLAAVVVALNFTPFFETLDRLQLETPILWLLAVALACSFRGRNGVAGAAVGIAAAFKVYPAFLLLAFLLRRRWAALPGFFAGMLLATAFSVTVLGAGVHRVWLTQVLPAMLGEQAILWTENMSPVRSLQTEFGAGAGVARWIGVALALGLLAVTARSSWQVGGARAPGRPGDAGRRLDGVVVAWSVPVMLLAMPNSWANYQLLLLVPAITLPLLLPGGSARNRVAACSVVVLALVLAYAPCEGPELFRYAWPCAQTPHTLGLFRLSRPLHDFWVELRPLAPLAAWLGGWLAAREVSREASGPV